MDRSGQRVKSFLFKAADQKCRLLTSISCILTIIYILEKNKYSGNSIKAFVLYVNELVSLCETSREDIIAAVQSNFKDLEDAILYQTALSNQCKAIITQNVQDYPKNSKLIKVIKPDEF